MVVVLHELKASKKFASSFRAHHHSNLDSVRRGLSKIDRSRRIRMTWEKLLSLILSDHKDCSIMLLSPSEIWYSQGGQKLPNT